MAHESGNENLVESLTVMRLISGSCLADNEEIIGKRLSAKQKTASINRAVVW